MSGGKSLEQDQVNPVFCIKCRKQVPIALSNQNKGLCDDCLDAKQALAQAAKTQTVMATIGDKPTVCPVCRSVNISQYQNKARNDARTICSVLALALLAYGFFGNSFQTVPAFAAAVVLFLVGLCLPSQKLISNGMHCSSCGHRWLY